MPQRKIPFYSVFREKTNHFRVGSRLAVKMIAAHCQWQPMKMHRMILINFLVCFFQIVVCRRTLYYLRRSFVCWVEWEQFFVHVARHHRRHQRNCGQQQEKKLRMPSLALKTVATMAISHHQIENCMRRVLNKTRTLPFVFCGAGDATAARIYTARIPCRAAGCRKSIIFAYKWFVNRLYSFVGRFYYLLGFVCPPLNGFRCRRHCRDCRSGPPSMTIALESDGAQSACQRFDTFRYVRRGCSRALRAPDKFVLVETEIEKREWIAHVTFVWLNATEVHSEFRIRLAEQIASPFLSLSLSVR